MTQLTRSGGRDSNLLTFGEETIERDMVVTASLTTSNTLHLTYFTARKSESVANVRMVVGGTAAATITLSRVGLYLVRPSGDLLLAASTVSDTSAFGSTFSGWSKALQASYTKRAGQRYALGVLTVATTQPALYAVTSLVPTEAAQAPRTSARLTSQTDLPDTIATGSLSTSNLRFYGAVYP